MKARHQGWRSIWVSLVALVASAAWITPAAAASNPDKPRQFLIESGPAEARLNEFSAQSGLQMVFGFDGVRGLTTQAVRGRYKPTEALAMMIKGTNMTFELLNRRTVAIKLRETEPAGTLAPSRRPSVAKRIDRRAPDATLEEVSIRAIRPAASLPATGSSHYALSRRDIDAGGYVTVQSVVSTLPQIFGGGPTEDTDQVGFEAVTNTARGSGVNLRGLGASATLVLMNGRRLPGSGSEGLFVDVSNLPLAAVERIDILPDNSSTFYGSDAVGGVVNFVMRDDFEGALTEAFYGTATKGQMNQNYLSQVFGTRGETRRGLLAFDFYSRDNLPASERSQAKSDLSAFGGSNFDGPHSTGGTVLLGPLTWAIPERADGGLPQPSDFRVGTANLQNRYEGADILPSQQRWTIFGTGQQQFGNNFTLFLDALYGQRDMRRVGSGQPANLVVPPTNAFYVNPTPVPGPVNVAYNFLRDIGPLRTEVAVETKDVAAVLDWKPNSRLTMTGTLGLAGEGIDADFDNSIDRVALSAALADSNPATALNVFGGPATNPVTLASLRAQPTFSMDSLTRTIGLTASAEVAPLPGGNAVLSVGGEQRNQSFDMFTRETATGPIRTVDLDRKVWAAFAELRLPLIGDESEIRGLRRLELSLAERFESYDDFGDTDNTRLGLSWQPAAGLTIRSTYSESFRPPGLVDIDESSNAYQYIPVRNPQGGPPVMTLALIGKNRDLQEERAHSWTAGFTLTSQRTPGTAFAITYFDIEFRDRLSQPGFDPNILLDPSLTPLVTLNPSAAYREEVCSRAPLSAQAVGCLTAPVTAIIDLRVRNDAVVRTSGFDLLASYERASKLGQLSLGINGTYILDFSEAKASYLPELDKVSTPNYPINLRFRASAQLQRGPLGIAGFVDYANSYLDTVSAPRRHVGSWTTFDLHASYRLGEAGLSALGETTLSLGIDNLFDERPPFLNNAVGIGYDQENGDLTGRIVSITLRKKW